MHAAVARHEGGDLGQDGYGTRKAVVGLYMEPVMGETPLMPVLGYCSERRSLSQQTIIETPQCNNDEWGKSNIEGLKKRMWKHWAPRRRCSLDCADLACRPVTGPKSRCTSPKEERIPRNWRHWRPRRPPLRTVTPSSSARLNQETGAPLTRS